jgi:hypothetical protein
VRLGALGLAVLLASTGASAPEIRAERWLNGAPPGDLRGRVVLVEFWTFG